MERGEKSNPEFLCLFLIIHFWKPFAYSSVIKTKCLCLIRWMGRRWRSYWSCMTLCMSRPTAGSLPWKTTWRVRYSATLDIFPAKTQIHRSESNHYRFNNKYMTKTWSHLNQTILTKQSLLELKCVDSYSDYIIVFFLAGVLVKKMYFFYFCSLAGQSQWSSLVLVAARCPSPGEPGPAHHPGHGLPQGPPHCHPKGPNLRHPQEAPVIAWEN